MPSFRSELTLYKLTDALLQEGVSSLLLEYKDMDKFYVKVGKRWGC